MSEISKKYWYLTKRRLNISQVPEENFDIVYAESGVPENDPHVDVLGKFVSLGALNKTLAELTESEYDLIIGKEVL